jgi:cadmium resistance protein CadD (predicted permease)
LKQNFRIATIVTAIPFALLLILWFSDRESGYGRAGLAALLHIGTLIVMAISVLCLLLIWFKTIRNGIIYYLLGLLNILLFLFWGIQLLTGDRHYFQDEQMNIELHANNLKIISGHLLLGITMIAFPIINLIKKGAKSWN